ncbi:39S ribosomal protein L55, mitochondrial-like [Talpa occidentalis]|uniref:39S ribosomal protein L55, mitochondrial-like n=1 Tax=Talpa occidentalis TaxID=50954 RepID=UPI00188E50B3|nr:39S ribosomal protein L55, mitochondrial-like [Talpa occidentalis]
MTKWDSYHEKDDSKSKNQSNLSQFTDDMINNTGLSGRIASVGSLPRLLRQCVLGCRPHVFSWRATSSRASLTRLHWQNYARLYPVLLVRQDGSTIHIRYQKPQRMLVMPVDLDGLSPEERRGWFWKREAQLRVKKEEEPVLGEDFHEEWYKQFWTKK